MKRVVFLTPNDAWPGFELAGMEQQIAESNTAVSQLLEQVSDPETGLIVIDERLLAYLDDDLLMRLDRQAPGKVTVLPAPEPGESTLALEIIRKAIGYHVRIGE